MRTLSEALAADGVTLTVNSSTVLRGQRDFVGTFHCEGRTMLHTWSQSEANPDLNPTAVSVLAPAIRNAQTVEAADSYEDWAGDFSFNRDEWMPKDTYTAWLKIAENLRTLLGDSRYESYGSDEVEHDD